MMRGWSRSGPIVRFGDRSTDAADGAERGNLSVFDNLGRDRKVGLLWKARCRI